MKILILLFVIVYPIYLIVKNITDKKISQKEMIPVNSNNKIRIGMKYEEIINSIDKENINREDDMGNGYKWIRAWINPFGTKICASLCFNSESKLESIEIYPYIIEDSKPLNWEDACEENMNYEYEICNKWYSKYRKYFPNTTEVCKDIRNWSAVIIIR